MSGLSVQARAVVLSNCVSFMHIILHCQGCDRVWKVHTISVKVIRLIILKEDSLIWKASPA